VIAGRLGKNGAAKTRKHEPAAAHA